MPIDDVSALLDDAATRAKRYLRALPDRPVAPTAHALEALDRLDAPLPARTGDPRDTLALLDEVGGPATVATAGARYFGFVIGGAVPVGVAAGWLAGAWDQNTGFVATSPVGARLEAVAIRWLVELLDLPASVTGSLVTGATMANFTALAAARRSILLREGWDVEADGLFGAPPVTVVVSDEVHVTVLKALALLGFGRERVTRVPTDAQGRMRADAFPRLAGPTIVCLQAGNVNSGAFDPAVDVCGAARAANAWVHVDGAFGLWARAAPARAHLGRGLELADSWAVDAHKWLNSPYDCGVALVRDGEALRGAMATTAAYTQPIAADPRAPREPCHFTPEFSRRARGVEVWAVLRHLGRDGVADLIERTCRLAARAEARLRAAGHAILNDVVLNQVMVSFGTPDRTRRVIAAVQRDGTCWAGATVWQGKTAMRISVSGHATTEADIDASIDAIVRVAAQEP